MIIIGCTCGRRFQTQDANAGKRTKCPMCGSMLIVPGPDSVADVLSPPKVPATPPPWWFPKEKTGGAISSPSPPAPKAPSAKVGDLLGVDTSSTDELDRQNVPSGSDAVFSRWTGKPAILVGFGAGALFAVAVLLWYANATTSGPDTQDRPGADRIVAAGPGPAFRNDSPPSEPNAPRDATPPMVVSPASDLPPPSASATREGSAGPAPADSPQAVAAGKAARPRLIMLIPAYFYPSGPGLKLWERLIEDSDRVPIVAVVNPATGPGESSNLDYGSIVRRASKRKLVLIGYVSTNYGQRPMTEVTADVDHWVEFYPEIRGIFFDAQPSDAKHVEHYARLREYARKKIEGALVVANPGTLCDGAFAARPTSDAYCVFMSSTGFENFRLPRTADRQPPGLFAAMPYQVASADRMKDYIQMASNRGIGYLYVTDAKSPNPWGGLPSYWDAEVEGIAKVNLGEKP